MFNNGLLENVIQQERGDLIKYSNIKFDWQTPRVIFVL